MISNNMLRLAATAHEAELRRGAKATQHTLDRHVDRPARPSHLLQCLVARMLHTGSARRGQSSPQRGQSSPVIPRVSI